MIRKSNIFWGGVLLIIGVIILADNLGIVEINLWGIIGPLLLILFGVWVLLSYYSQGEPVVGDKVDIPLENAAGADLNIHHGAGRLKISSGTDPLTLVSGNFGGGLKYQSHRKDDVLKISMRIRDAGFPIVIFPWLWGVDKSLDWDFRLSDEIPLTLKLNTGANDSLIDLTNLQVTNLRVETGASATEVYLPDNVPHTKAVIKAGAASVKIKVPDVVAARIRVSGGLMGSSVDQKRFPNSGGFYQSPEYEGAPNKVEIKVDVGLGSVTIG